MRNFDELKFKRTIWADRQLCKLAPGNNIQRLGEVLGSEDFDIQISAMMKIVCIMNEGYERYTHFLDKSHVMDVVTIEELENLTEDELAKLANRAFEVITEDGKTTVEAEPEKKEDLPESI